MLPQRSEETVSFWKHRHSSSVMPESKTKSFQLVSHRKINQIEFSPSSSSTLWVKWKIQLIIFLLQVIILLFFPKVNAFLKHDKCLFKITENAGRYTTYFGILVWNLLFTGILPLGSSSIPSSSSPKFWVKGRRPMQTSSTSQVITSALPPEAASILGNKQHVIVKHIYMNSWQILET